MKKAIIRSLIIVLFLFIFMNNSYAKFASKIKGKGTAYLKEPIIILEKKEILIGEISKTNNEYIQDFYVRNYLENKINEIEFEYLITLNSSTINFPVKYKLIKLDTNEELKLDSKMQTTKIFMGTEKTIHRYRLVVNWCELDTKEKVDDIVEVKIKIKAEQIEKENL